MHIKIKTPKESGPNYFSRLQQHDVVVQAVADGEKRFLDVAAGFQVFQSLEKQFTLPKNSQ